MGQADSREGLAENYPGGQVEHWGELVCLDGAVYLDYCSLVFL